MAEVISNLGQLVNAFKTHYKFSKCDNEKISHLLLLFYAVECGLKAKYLREFRGLSTEDFVNLPVAKKYGHGHDIWEWVRILRLPNFGYEDDKDNRPIIQMHERLRYGTYTVGEKEKQQIKFLKDLVSNLSETI